MGILFMVVDLQGKECYGCGTLLTLDNLAHKDDGEVLEYDRKNMHCAGCYTVRSGVVN
jgi:hypothetical protein